MTECQCACGATTFRTLKPPRFRMLCHCTICQRFNRQPFADVLIYRAADVEMPEAGTVDFAAYKPPPNVQRGQCAGCRAPVIETFHVPLLPKLTMVPRSMLPSDADLPEPVAHFFYETRQSDADDSLPRHEGFWPSQTAFLKYYLRSGKAG